jgi:hypothetical protein
MRYLSQRDQAWGGVKIGKTNALVRDKGCLIACVSMSSDWFGCYRNPGDCAQKLSFTNSVLLLWASIGGVFSNMTFLWREYKYTKPMISEALKNPAKTCILNVDKGGHWVLALNEIGFGKYWVCDPWDGRRKIYGGVVGCAVLKRK